MQAADKELLTRFFHNECAPEEIAAAHELLRFPEGEAFLKELAAGEWEEPVKENEALQTLYSGMKEKLNARIKEDAPVARKGILQKMYRFRHAAIWMGLLLVTAGILRQYTRTATPPAIAVVEKKNESGIPVRYLLPDSSELFLAAGSKLSYPASFSGDTREVNLEGEAFFDIAPNPGRPFIIHTGDVHTQVLGTSFKIIALKNRPLEVAVATGKVKVERKGKSLATLTPGNKVTWYENGQKAVMATVNANSLLNWKTGELMFDRQTMASIVEELQRIYKVQIEIMDAGVSNNKVSGTFPAGKSIDQVLKVLALAGKFRYESNNKAYRIFQLK